MSEDLRSPLERLRDQWCRTCKMLTRNDSGRCLECGDRRPGKGSAVGRLMEFAFTPDGEGADARHLQHKRDIRFVVNTLNDREALLDDIERVLFGGLYGADKADFLTRLNELREWEAAS